MKAMTAEQKIKYEKLVSDARQLCFGDEPPAMDKEGKPLYICMGKFQQYYFSRYPDESDSEE